MISGDEGIRTLDLSDANRTLSQLSYAPKVRFSRTPIIILSEGVFVKDIFSLKKSPTTPLLSAIIFVTFRKESGPR